ncbi:MAG: iron-sulfur cluster assembly scaffold protein [Thermoprotei archaeon]
MSEIFEEKILYHYEHPSNRGVIDGAQIRYRDMNTLCGDQVTIYASLNGDTISDIKFQGVGCAISMASTSMLTEKVKGMNIRDVLQLGQKDVLDMLGIETLTPMRMKCAMLGLRTLQKGVLEYTAKSGSQSPPANGSYS